MHNPVGGRTDKAFLAALLRESREKFLGSFAGVSDEDSRLRPMPDCWCVLETVEHLTLSEVFMLKLVTSQRVPRSADAPDREQLFLHGAADRSRKMRSPEGGRPCGRFASLTEAAA